MQHTWSLHLGKVQLLSKQKQNSLVLCWSEDKMNPYNLKSEKKMILDELEP